MRGTHDGLAAGKLWNNQLQKLAPKAGVLVVKRQVSYLFPSHTLNLLGLAAGGLASPPDATPGQLAESDKHVRCDWDPADGSLCTQLEATPMTDSHLHRQLMDALQLPKNASRFPVVRCTGCALVVAACCCLSVSGQTLLQKRVCV